MRHQLFDSYKATFVYKLYDVTSLCKDEVCELLFSGNVLEEMEAAIVLQSDEAWFDLSG
jgi:hypothetical protein